MPKYSIPEDIERRINVDESLLRLREKCEEQNLMVVEFYQNLTRSLCNKEVFWMGIVDAYEQKHGKLSEEEVMNIHRPKNEPNKNNGNHAAPDRISGKPTNIINLQQDDPREETWS